jgi:hypothetical protein
LFVFVRKISRVHLEQFLTALQRLRRLELVVSFGGELDLLDGYQWEIFIIERLPLLSTFNFKFCMENMNRNVLDQYRSRFWLDRHWYVAYLDSHSFLFTVPYFVPISINDSYSPILSDSTTLPIEQHNIFYDRVTELRFQSDEWIMPYRYNHIKTLYLDGPCIHKNVIDLSKVQSLTVNTSDWSWCMIIELIKESMPNVHELNLHCLYPGIHRRHFRNISLNQIRTLCISKYGELPTNDLFDWSRIFPCVETLTVTINTKHQIPFLIDRFKNMSTCRFYTGFGNNDVRRRLQSESRVTRKWLIKNTYRLRNNDNFICRIDYQYHFSLDIWIGDNNY